MVQTVAARVLLAVMASLIPVLALAAPAMPVPESQSTPAGFAEAQQAYREMLPLIGNYPTKITSAAEHERVYGQWRRAMSLALAAEAEQPGAEANLFLSAELARLGNNLDVSGAAEYAVKSIRKCLAIHAGSYSCHWSASHIFMQLPGFKREAEASLLTLRKLSLPKVNMDVEQGLVMVYLFQGRNDEALRQFDYILSVDPNFEWARRGREALIAGKIRIRTE